LAYFSVGKPTCYPFKRLLSDREQASPRLFSCFDRIENGVAINQNGEMGNGSRIAPEGVFSRAGHSGLVLLEGKFPRAGAVVAIGGGIA
jgi:hypothetical protein